MTAPSHARTPSPEPGSDAPLAGITVVEVGVFMAAPFATMQLADLGARVIKVEPPRTGDPCRTNGPFVDGESAPFLRINRGKESVALDLKSEAGKTAFRRLLAGADVLVENLRPGALRRLGLGYDDLAADLPALVYCSASGWGQDGPLAQRPGLDIMAQARGGLMSVTGTPDGDPMKVGVPIADLTCGLYAALGILAALRERDRSGRGQYLDVSLMESAVSYSIYEAGRYFTTGEVARPQGSAHQSSAPYQALRTADGYATVGAITAPTWAALCRELDLPDLLEDPRYVGPTERLAHRDTLIPAIEAVTAGIATEDLVQRLDAAGVPTAPINDYGQVYTDEHLNARDFFWDAEHDAGPVRQIGSPMRLSRTPARRGGAGPRHGDRTRAVLEELGYTPAQVDAMLAAGEARQVGEARVTEGADA